MFELPECVTLAKQLNTTLAGHAIACGNLGNSPHKFVWYNRTHDEFADLTHGRLVGTVYSRGKWIFVPLEPGYVLVLGECGGKLLYHAAGTALPKKYHLLLSLDNGAALSAMTQMWGAMELYEQGREQGRAYIQGMRRTPTDQDFTCEYFSKLIDEALQTEKYSAKGLLTRDQLIPGLGNAIAQDILFQAQLHPRHSLESLNEDQRRRLYQAIISTIAQAVEQGGRYDEYDLYGHPGGYRRLMDRHAVDRPCPRCGGPVETMQYLGGACYFCPECQT